MAAERTDEDVRDLLARVSAGLEKHSRVTRLLSAVAWPREVEEKFFAAVAVALPAVSNTEPREEDCP